MANTALIEKVASQIKADGVSAIMVAPGADMRFLLGHTPLLCERYQAFFITEEAQTFYICNDLYKDEMADILDAVTPVYHWSDSAGFRKLCGEVLEKYGLRDKKIAINGNVRACNVVQLLEEITFIPVNGRDYIEKTRIIKTPGELEHLRVASRIADKAFEAMKSFIKPGVTEKEIGDEIARVCVAEGADFGFGGIIAVNEHAALPHYMGNAGVVTEKCIVLMDYGCSFKGMMADTTRCLFVGRATEREREIYNIVLAANLAGEAAAKNGAWIPDVDAAARNVIEEKGYGEYFNHRLGHGIGYAPHEAPYIRGDYEMHLAPGMAFSCEPGIYIKDEIGIRIEDVVIINEKGETEVLNHTSKELTEICC